MKEMFLVFFGSLSLICSPLLAFAGVVLECAIFKRDNETMAIITDKWKKNEGWILFGTLFFTLNAIISWFSYFSVDSYIYMYVHGIEVPLGLKLVSAGAGSLVMTSYTIAFLALWESAKRLVEYVKGKL